MTIDTLVQVWVRLHKFSRSTTAENIVKRFCKPIPSFGSFTWAGVFAGLSYPNTGQKRSSLYKIVYLTV